MNKVSYLLVCSAVAVFASAASHEAAAQATWNLGGSTCNPTPTNNSNQLPATNTINCGNTSGTPSLTADMWAAGNTGSGKLFQLGQLGSYDPWGFGAYTGASESGTGNQHAFDDITTNCATGVSNSGSSTPCGGSQELMLIHFSTAVNLTSVALSIFGTGDASILAWTGPKDVSSNPGPNAGSILQQETSDNYVGTFSSGGISGNSYINPTGGWTLVSSQDTVANGTKITNPNDSSQSAQLFTASSGYGYSSSSSSLYSSWWMISTYNGPPVSSANLSNSGTDAFKILSFTVNTCSTTVTGANTPTDGTCTQVPEPGSLALTGAALVGLCAGRRRILRAVSLKSA